MTTTYTLSTYTDQSEDSDQGQADTTNITFNFETDNLDKIVEKFFWFLQAAGYSYVDEVNVNRGEFVFPSGK